MTRRAFASRVLAAVRRIPPGRVSTYGDVAAIAGRPGAARAVGNIMRQCAAPDVPCHRVVAAAGGLGGYGTPGLKRALLHAEGVAVRGARIRDFEERRWQGANGKGEREKEKGERERETGRKAATRRGHGPV